MQSQGCVLIKDCGSDDEHRQFEKKLFEDPNGIEDVENDYPIRLILSSFYFIDGVQGIPDGKSDCANCEIECNSCTGVSYAPAHDDSSTGYDKSDYSRPHRDAEIIKSMQTWMKI